jgi:hypothetical protein
MMWQNRGSLYGKTEEEDVAKQRQTTAPRKLRYSIFVAVKLRRQIFYSSLWKVDTRAVFDKCFVDIRDGIPEFW